MAMLGREVMMPAALIARLPEEPHCTTVPFVRDLRDTLRDAHQRVRDATRSSARTQKLYYDERSKQAVFTEGQLVWLFWPRPPVRQRFHKLQRLWTGPWRTESFKSPLVVVLKHTVKRTRQTVYTWTACRRAIRHHQPCLKWTPGSLPTHRLPRTDKTSPTGIASPSLGWKRTASRGGL